MTKRLVLKEAYIKIGVSKELMESLFNPENKTEVIEEFTKAFLIRNPKYKGAFIDTIK